MQVFLTHAPRIPFMKKRLALLLLFAAAVLVHQGRPAPSETSAFPAKPGDRIVLQNDFGRITIRGSSAVQVSVATRANLASGSADHVLVSAVKTGDEISIHSSFRSAPGESVDIEVEVPRFINVVVFGENPEVDIRDIDGYVRINSRTGRITAKDLTSSASLTSERGDIQYLLHQQPTGDTRIETIHGQAGCMLSANVNLRIWARAGGMLSGRDIEQPRAGVFEKQIGSGGPLLYVSSLRGPVKIDVDPPTATRAIQSKALFPGDPGLQQSQELAESATFKVSVDWVLLNVSVRDRVSNRSLPDLTQEDFLVYEDGVLQNVEHFETTEVPFNLLLLLDVSSSTQSHLNFIKAASIDFTRRIKEIDRVAIAIFNSKVQLIQGFTGDRDQVSRAIENIRSGGGTHFYDALQACGEEYMHDVEGRKAIVVFTDGVDNLLDTGEGSRITFEQLYKNIQELDPIIYPIFLNSGGDSGIGNNGAGGSMKRSRKNPGADAVRAIYDQAKAQLQTIADQTGGRMYSPHMIQDLPGVYSEIAEDLRVQYRIGYRPANDAGAGSWHAVRVKIKNKPDAVARTRRGYYARPSVQPSNHPVPPASK